MTDRTLPLVGCLLLLVGCSVGEEATSGPTSPPPATTSSSPVAAPSTDDAASGMTAVPSVPPAPTTAGDLSSSTFRAELGRWTAVPGEGDEGTYQPNGSWVHALDPAQAAQALSMQGCREGSLPRPQHVLASDYKDAAGRRAVGQALRFADAAQASAFLGAYRSLVTSCVGQANPMAATVLDQQGRLVDRRTMFADGSHWIEVVKVDKSLVRMFVANEQDQPLTPAEVASLTRDV